MYALKYFCVVSKFRIVTMFVIGELQTTFCKQYADMFTPYNSTVF